MKKAEAIAKVTGAAVMFLHHVNKGMAMAGRTDEQQSVRGASSLVDNARWQSAVVAMSPDDAKKYGLTGKPGERERHKRFVVTKYSHSKQPETLWLRSGDGGVLVRTNPQPEPTTSTLKAVRGGGFNGRM